MFALIVCPLSDAKHYMANRWPTHVISLITDIAELPIHGSQHLRLEFDDIAQPTSGHVHPTIEHLDAILAFTADLTDSDRVLAHCQLGLGRSTAAAIGVLIQHGMNYDDAYRYVARQRRWLAPNWLLVRYIDERFALHGDLIKLIDDNELMLVQAARGRILLP